MRKALNTTHIISNLFANHVTIEHIYAADDKTDVVHLLHLRDAFTKCSDDGKHAERHLRRVINFQHLQYSIEVYLR